MAFLKGTGTYWKFAGTCTECRHCTPACPSLEAAGMTLGEIAKGMIDVQAGAESADEVRQRIAQNPQLVQAVRGCFFCTTCQNTCFAHNDVCGLVYQAREDFQNLGLIPRETWSSVEVDKEWDIFTAYRAVHGIWYVDLVKHLTSENHQAETDCDVAFFPGCSMAAYAPELTREIFDTIQELGGKTTLIDHCCGSPLESAGFLDRADALINLIADEIAQSGAKQVVCVCPGCANHVRKILAKRAMDVETVSLSAFLAGHGFKPKRPLPDAPIYLSKSCQDRDGTYLRETCLALGIDPGTPAVFHGCCGAGGAVSAFQPDRQDRQADENLSFAPDGACVVTMCPTCTYTYASRLLANPRPLVNKHYAELLFENQFDWDKVFGQLNSMWTGEYGPWLAQVFA